MDGFPYYLAPFQKWLTDKLKARAADQNLSNRFTPFAMLSSGAVVAKGSAKDLTARKEEVSGLLSSGTGIYNGCVITNTTNVKNLYRTGDLIAGYDLNGKEIVVEGSQNSRVSVPIIESIEIDTDDANNTLKTARVNVRVFTLKQLEMFELFFLRPSMNVVLEFGCNDGFDLDNQNTIKSNLFIKKNFEEYKTAVKKIYSSAGYIKQRDDYKKLIKDTKGNYEYMPGKVTNFTIGINPDLTYSIMIEISSGNELQLWFPLQQAKQKGLSLVQDADKKATEYTRWLTKLAVETGRAEFLTLFNDEKKYKNEFFNWGKQNKSGDDQRFSKTPYISFSLILDIINNSSFAAASKNKIIPIFIIDDKVSIPVTSTKYIISATDLLIIPGDVAHIVVDPKKDEIVIKEDTVSAPINGDKKFNYASSATAGKKELESTDGSKISITIPDSVGNLLNVFVSYDYFITLYTSSYCLADLVNGLLELITSNMFGLCNLQLSKIIESDGITNLTIIDTKMQTYPTKGVDETEKFRFKIGTKESIIRELNFSTELSVLQQAQALYSSQLLAISAEKENEGKVDKDKKQVPYKEETEYADFSFARNTDNYYSLNILEYEIVKEQNAEAKKIEQLTNSSQQKPAPTEADKVDKTKIREEKFVRFKDVPDAELIYKDPALIQAKISVPAEMTTVLSSIELSLTIDGTSGISCGEYFEIEGIPEIYNQNGVFQVLNVKHSVDENGWRTVIEAGFRYTN